MAARHLLERLSHTKSNGMAGARCREQRPPTEARNHLGIPDTQCSICNFPSTPQPPTVCHSRSHMSESHPSTSRNAVVTIFDGFRAELDDHNDRRERLIKVRTQTQLIFLPSSTKFTSQAEMSQVFPRRSYSSFIVS